MCFPSLGSLCDKGGRRGLESIGFNHTAAMFILIVMEHSEMPLSVSKRIKKYRLNQYGRQVIKGDAQECMFPLGWIYERVTGVPVNPLPCISDISENVKFDIAFWLG